MTAFPEQVLSGRDSKLAVVIAAQSVRWPCEPTEDPIWGILRIILAQQISTSLACRLAERVKAAYPHITNPSPLNVPKVAVLRAMGITERRAECCTNIIRRSDEIRASIDLGKTWAEALSGIKGIGPWTLAVFRIMVLREPDEFPMGDVGLLRAISNVYGPNMNVEQLANKWRPFRSVACWYLWRTLGNGQLG